MTKFEFGHDQIGDQIGYLVMTKFEFGRCRSLSQNEIATVIAGVDGREEEVQPEVPHDDRL